MNYKGKYPNIMNNFEWNNKNLDGKVYRLKDYNIQNQDNNKPENPSLDMSDIYEEFRHIKAYTEAHLQEGIKIDFHPDLKLMKDPSLKFFLDLDRNINKMYLN